MNKNSIKESNMSFASLPEDCIAHIISLTSPKDACVASAVSLGFKSAAESDTVWERYLPSDYKDIIGRSSSSSEHRLDQFSSLKELYFKLCDTPILLDEGKLSLRFIKQTGKKCYMVCARELSIAWQDNPMYWQWTSLPESRFAEVARLVSVFWLDIAGTLQASMLSPDANYAAYLVFKLADNDHGLEGRIKALVNYVDDDVIAENETRVANMVNIVSPRRPHPEARRQARIRLFPLAGRPPRSRTDGWSEVELGDIFVGRDEKRHIRFRFYETERLNWKSGLIVDGIELRPKGYSCMRFGPYPRNRT